MFTVEEGRPASPPARQPARQPASPPRPDYAGWCPATSDWLTQVSYISA